MCPCCLKKPVAVNYHKYGKIYYRNKCSVCYGRKKKPAPPGWVRTGYKKKDNCERCGFKFKYPEQSKVHHVDGDLTHNDWINLKTICVNCEVELTHAPGKWRNSKIVPDR